MFTHATIIDVHRCTTARFTSDEGREGRRQDLHALLNDEFKGGDFEIAVHPHVEFERFGVLLVFLVNRQTGETIAQIGICNADNDFDVVMAQVMIPAYVGKRAYQVGRRAGEAKAKAELNAILATI